MTNRKIYARLESAPKSVAHGTRNNSIGVMSLSNKPCPYAWAVTTDFGFNNVFFQTRQEAETYAKRRGFNVVLEG